MTTGRLGMWVFLVTDALSFAAMFIAYAVLHARATEWAPPGAHANLALAGAATVALLASSPLIARNKVAITIALGVVFVALQAVEYATLLRAGAPSNPAASSFFAITGWHGLHVVAGLVALAWAARHRDALPTVALFWQLVDALWIIIVAILYVVPRAPAGVAWLVGFASLVGFGVVVAWPMNLRRESRAVKVIFVLPLVLPALYLVALVADAAANGVRP
jgi:heme/copper-type cytochrome/quinol oxidase subunit 3